MSTRHGPAAALAAFSPSVRGFQRERGLRCILGRSSSRSERSPVGAKQTGEGLSGGTQEAQLQRKNLEHLDREQVGKVAKKNQEALPELANVTERYVFFF